MCSGFASHPGDSRFNLFPDTNGLSHGNEQVQCDKGPTGRDEGTEERDGTAPNTEGFTTTFGESLFKSLAHSPARKPASGSVAHFVTSTFGPQDLIRHLGRADHFHFRKFSQIIARGHALPRRHLLNRSAPALRASKTGKAVEPAGEAVLATNSVAAKSTMWTSLATETPAAPVVEEAEE